MNDDDNKNLNVMSESGIFSGLISREGESNDKITVSAKNRNDAIAKILVIFWKKGYKDAKKCLVVPDILGEVMYDEQMKCSDPMLNYLPDEIVERVIQESEGEFGRDPDFPNSRCQLKRLKPKNYKKMRREGKLVRHKKGNPSPVVPSAPFVNKKADPKPEVSLWKNSELAKEGSRPPKIVPAWTPHANDGFEAKRPPLCLREMIQRAK